MGLGWVPVFGGVSEELLLVKKRKSGLVLGHSFGVKGHDQVGVEVEG